MAQYAGVARNYETRIAPKYRPIAAGLIARAGLRPGQLVLEVAAGTGCLTRLAAPLLQPGGHLVATDLNTAMIAIATETVPSRHVAYGTASYTHLPFRSRQFDAVLCSLCPLQESRDGLVEVYRVLKPGGQLAIAMWGPRYAEVRLVNIARRQAGLPAYPPAAPVAAVKRVARVGFVAVDRTDIKLDVVHESVEAYLDYREAFGRSTSMTSGEWDRFYAAFTALHQRRAGGGPVRLDWTITYLTAVRPAL